MFFIDKMTNNPLVGLKGDNLNLLQINLDFSDNPKPDIFPSGSYVSEALKSNQNFNNQTKERRYFPQNQADSHQNFCCFPNPRKFILESSFSPSKDDNNESLLNKKTKRKPTKKHSKSSSDAKLSNKAKIILKMFNEFKSASALIKEFAHFSKVEKNIKNNVYSSTDVFAAEMRKLFSEIFRESSFDKEKYNKTLILCENFENIYKNYDNKYYQKETKNLLTIINKLKKELKHSEEYRNVYNNDNYEKYNEIPSAESDN